MGESELEFLTGEPLRPLCRARPRFGGDGVRLFCVLILGSVVRLEGPRSKVGILTGLRLGGALARSGPSPQEV